MNGNTSADYYLFGHSAGAQFVHRLLLMVPDGRYAALVAANAGWYTVPDKSIDYPPRSAREATVTLLSASNLPRKPLAPPVMSSSPNTDSRLCVSSAPEEPGSPLKAQRTGSRCRGYD